MQVFRSNVNFKGAFRFPPSEMKAQKEVPELFTQGRQIFFNIVENGDEFIVVRDNYDKRIGSYIKENSVKDVEYYPEINTLCRLDSERPEELIEILKNGSKKVITNFEEMFAVIAKQRRAKKTLKVGAEVERVANVLRLNLENPRIKSSTSSTIVRDEEKKRTIEIIATNKAISYVHVRPDSISEASTMCVIDRKGDVKTFVTPNEIHNFYKVFKQLKSANKNILVNG